MIYRSTERARFLNQYLNETGRRLTVSQIEDVLEDEGFKKISVEGLRKALNKMCKDSQWDIKRVGTGYRDEFVGTAVDVERKNKKLTPQEIVRLALLAQTDISQVLPRVIREGLEPQQERACERMNYQKKAQYQDLLRWTDRVRLRRPSVRLAVDRYEPEIKTEVEAVIHDALINRTLLTVKYFSGHLSDALEEAVVYPIGLDCQLRWVTLVCQFAEPYKTQQAQRSAKYGDDYVQLPMHRISKAESHEGENISKDFDFNFNMEDYIDRAEPDRPRGGDQGFTHGKVIKLVARVTQPCANDLLDSPIVSKGGDQSLVLQDDGWYLLTVEVVQSDNLLWWCGAMAGDLVVVEPESFRQTVVEFLDNGRAAYV